MLITIQQIDWHPVEAGGKKDHKFWWLCGVGVEQCQVCLGTRPWAIVWGGKGWWGQQSDCADVVWQGPAVQTAGDLKCLPWECLAKESNKTVTLCAPILRERCPDFYWSAWRVILQHFLLYWTCLPDQVEPVYYLNHLQPWYILFNGSLVLQVVGCASLFLGDITCEPLEVWMAITRPKTGAAAWGSIVGLASGRGVPEIKVSLSLIGNCDTFKRRRSSFVMFDRTGSLSSNLESGTRSSFTSSTQGLSRHTARNEMIYIQTAEDM